MLLCPLILASSCSSKIGASTDVASCRRSWRRKSRKYAGFGLRDRSRHTRSYWLRALCRARINALVAAPGVIVKIGPRAGREARYRLSVSRAHGVSGTSRDVPFFVSGKCMTPWSKSTCSRRIVHISVRRMAVSAASVITTGSSFDAVALMIHSISLRGQSDADTPRIRIRSITRRSRASFTVGRRTSCTGFASSVHPQSFRATVKTWDTNARRRTTVDAALSASHSSRRTMRSEFLILSIGREAMRVESQTLAIDCSAVLLFLRGDTSTK